MRGRERSAAELLVKDFTLSAKANLCQPAGSMPLTAARWGPAPRALQEDAGSLTLPGPGGERRRGPHRGTRKADDLRF